MGTIPIPFITIIILNTETELHVWWLAGLAVQSNIKRTSWLFVCSGLFAVHHKMCMLTAPESSIKEGCWRLQVSCNTLRCFAHTVLLSLPGKACFLNVPAVTVKKASPCWAPLKHFVSWIACCSHYGTQGHQWQPPHSTADPNCPCITK